MSEAHKKFINICSIIIIIGVIALFIELHLRKIKIEELEEENGLLSSNLTYVLNQMKSIQEALETREFEYKKIKEDSNKLNEKLQEIENNANEKEKNWLEGIIPSSIDNTIPY